jgi:hypothetical protein
MQFVDGDFILVLWRPDFTRSFREKESLREQNIYDLSYSNSASHLSDLTHASM